MEDGFISDNPEWFPPEPSGSGGSGSTGSSSGGYDDGAGGSFSGGGTGGGGNGVWGMPEPAQDEADLIELQGDRLYALSGYGNLSVVDVAQPDGLNLLGRFRTQAKPFALYLRGNVAVALLNLYSRLDAAEDPIVSGRLLALDVSNPADIRVLSDTTVPGDVTASKLVGDMLYVVTSQSRFCDGCGGADRTAVTAFDLRQPSSVGQAGQQFFDIPNGCGSSST